MELFSIGSETTYDLIYKKPDLSHIWLKYGGFIYLIKRFYQSKSHLTHWKFKTIPILIINEVVFMLHFVKQRAFFSHQVQF